MKTKLYSELRAEMRRQHIKIVDVAGWLGLKDYSIERRLRNECPWKLDEMYTILDGLHIPNNKMHILFPPNGEWAGALEEPPSVNRQLLIALRKLINECVTGGSK